MRSLVIYQVFPRNHGPSGRLADVTADVERIAALGVDVLYLMPIHPIGEFRIMRLAPTQARARAWTALMAFSRGPFMIYAGQKSAARAWPSLFDRAPVQWGDHSMTGFLRTLTAATKHDAMRLGDFWLLGDEPVVQAAWANPAGEDLAPVGSLGLYGVFNVGGHRGRVHVQLPDGRYDDLVSGERLHVVRGRLAMPGPAVILEFAEPFEATLWRSSLLDVFLQVEAEEA